MKTDIYIYAMTKMIRKKQRRNRCHDLSTITLSWTISIHRWAESDYSDTYRKNKFWSPLLIWLVFRSYHTPHPVFTPKPFQSLSCFCHVFIPILILFLSGIHLNLYPTSISISISIMIIILLVSWFHSRPNLISILVLLWFCTPKASF